VLAWQAKTNGKDKKAEKLQEGREQVATRAATLAGKQAIMHKLRHEAELRKLWKQVEPPVR
jgi:hypothetical protein